MLVACSMLIGFASAPTASFAIEHLPMAPDTPEDGLLGVTPDRWLSSVDPGSSTTFKLTVTNKTGGDATVFFIPTDLEPAKDPARLSDVVSDAKYGAGDWIQPEVPKATLPNLSKVVIDVTVAPPKNAPVGSNFGGLLVQLKTPENPDIKSSGAAVIPKAQALVQIYPRVNGPVIKDLEITKVEAEETLKFLGSRFVRYDIEYENKGTVNEAVGGSLLINSMFGNTVEKLAVPELLVLRGAKRRVRVVWTDPPRFGRFTSQVKVDTSAGQERKQGDTVTILPPWWVILAIVLTILFGIFFTWRRKNQDWRQYLDEEDWDEDFDDEDLVES